MLFFILYLATFNILFIILLEKASAAVAAAEARIDALYLRWTELEAKLK